MNILIISQYFWPENFRINDLALGLVERGNKVTVLTGIPNYPDGRFFPGYGIFKRSREEYRGVRIVRIPVVPRGRGSALRLIINYISFTVNACLMAPFLFFSKFDIIFFSLSPLTEGIPALVMKKIKKLPIIFWVQDLWPESLSATGVVTSSLFLKVIGNMVRFLYLRCDRILVQSRAFIPVIEKRGGDAKRISYFPNSAEELYLPVYVEPDAPERKNIPGGFCVMFAGNIGAAQDFETILSAAEQLKEYDDIHWVIIGDGRLRSWVEAQIDERGLTKTFHLLGRHPVELMPRFFSLADIMLVTLKKEYIFSLTVPSKVQSYLACAKPIIAAIDGEVAMIVEESGAGIACPAENPQALAEAVLKTYHMPKADLQEMGLRGRSYFEQHFERTVLIDRLNEWIKELKKGE
ncbi:MAG: glycosyltransferase family 4 protein [Desulfobacterales bacterium]|nr:glycosyltransferase family 4 protein [Desulfobacterales bacterium]